MKCKFCDYAVEISFFEEEDPLLREELSLDVLAAHVAEHHPVAYVQLQEFLELSCARP